MTERPTPRTDTETRQDEYDHVDSEFGPFAPSDFVSADFARQLERELAEARDEAEEQARLLGMSGEREAKLLAELAEAKEQRDRLIEVVRAATALVAAKGRHNTILAYEGLRDALKLSKSAT